MENKFFWGFRWKISHRVLSLNELFITGCLLLHVILVLISTIGSTYMYTWVWF